MKKLVLIVTLGVLLMGCEPSASVVNYPKAVDHLEHSIP